MKELHVELWDIERVKPYETNAKIHNNQQVEKIAKSIQEFGWDQPIVVDKDGMIIKGHGRRLASIKLGLKKVPVLVRSDLTEEQVKASRLADNRVAVGDIDTDILQKELLSLNIDLDGIFDKKELEFMSANLAELDDAGIVLNLDEEIRKQSEETRTKIDEVDARMVKIAKVLKFSEVKASDERHIAKFMALIEAENEDLSSGEAFVEFVKRYNRG